MYRLLDYLGRPRAWEEQDFVCAFIPQDILVHIESADGIDEEVRESVRSTIEASKETVKERQDVGDGDANPHEPSLPDPDARKLRIPGPQKHRFEKKSQGATVDIYDGRNSDYTPLPGPILRKNGQAPVEDQIANSCYDTMNKAQTFFRDVYGWDSLDDKNMPLVATVHYGWHVANAYFMSKYKQMVYGNGNKNMYNFVGSYDVVGHELAHGIIQFSSGLIYRGMPGALNEYCADVMGTLLEQWVHHQTVDKADWLLAQDVLFPGEDKIALRSMKAPGTAYNDPRVGRDSQPGHMKDYIYTEKDKGGVHFNSGIPNRAFYLAASAWGGNAWETAGKTWFAAMTTTEPNASFYGFASRTCREARRIGGPEWQSTCVKAWTEVGVFRAQSWFGWMWDRKTV